MKSQRCDKPLSLASGISLINIKIESIMAFLYSNPPSSRRILLRKFILQSTYHTTSHYICNNRNVGRTNINQIASARKNARQNVLLFAGAEEALPTLQPHQFIKKDWIEFSCLSESTSKNLSTTNLTFCYSFDDFQT